MARYEGRVFSEIDYKENRACLIWLEPKSL